MCLVQGLEFRSEGIEGPLLKPHLGEHTVLGIQVTVHLNYDRLQVMGDRRQVTGDRRQVTGDM